MRPLSNVTILLIILVEFSKPPLIQGYQHVTCWKWQSLVVGFLVNFVQQSLEKIRYERKVSGSPKAFGACFGSCMYNAASCLWWRGDVPILASVNQRSLDSMPGKLRACWIQSTQMEWNFQYWKVSWYSICYPEEWAATISEYFSHLLCVAESWATGGYLLWPV